MNIIIKKKVYIVHVYTMLKIYDIVKIKISDDINHVNATHKNLKIKNT